MLKEEVEVIVVVEKEKEEEEEEEWTAEVRSETKQETTLIIVNVVLEEEIRFKRKGSLATFLTN